MPRCGLFGRFTIPLFTTFMDDMPAIKLCLLSMMKRFDPFKYQKHSIIPGIIRYYNNILLFFCYKCGLHSHSLTHIPISSPSPWLLWVIWLIVKFSEMWIRFFFFGSRNTIVEQQWEHSSKAIRSHFWLNVIWGEEKNWTNIGLRTLCTTQTILLLQVTIILIMWVTLWTLNEHKNKRNHCNKNEAGKRSEETKDKQSEAHAFSSIISTTFVKIIFFFLLLFHYHCDAIMYELNLMNGVRLSLSDLKLYSLECFTGFRNSYFILFIAPEAIICERQKRMQRPQEQFTILCECVSSALIYQWTTCIHGIC